MNYLWSHPGATVTACRDALDQQERPLRETTVRTLLQRLETKGLVKHSLSGRTFLYHAVERRSSFAARSVKQIIDRFCGGSIEELLVGMVENDLVDREELASLAKTIGRQGGAGQ